MRSTLILLSSAYSMAFSMPATVRSTSSTVKSHDASLRCREVSREAKNVAASFGESGDEWTSGLVFNRRPLVGRSRHQQKGNKRGAPLGVALSTSGGEQVDTSVAEMPKRTFLGLLASTWGSLGVVYILLNPMKRLLPIAVLPFQATPTAPEHALGLAGWLCYAGWVAFMGYAEGYKGFQRKFSPMVVTRAATLEAGPFAAPPSSPLTSAAPLSKVGRGAQWALKALFAPLYSMGLFSAAKKRVITSWSMVLGIGAIVALCKRAPLPARCVIDGGVVMGLGWGAASVLVLYVRSLVSGKPPQGVDPCLPGTAAAARS